ncbi:folliculin-interacting protein 2 isoform X2 [Pieris rapae]|uniref:folliculin-interacting protein 2 isoform X2 n=1 Tax=Pieris rapae TaxID=64459 RepID=UPI001E27CD2D|nr:folliculin-interacting protein 2 isoform X2 [Pieris rapae]
MILRSCEGAIEQVRLLLYKECEKRGKKVLFDSSTIEKLSANKNDKPESGTIPCILEVSEGHTYLYKGPASDAGVLGEMMFGAVAMNCKSVSLKIHIMDDPKRLMCTKIFCVPTTRKTSRGKSDINGNISDINSSLPLNVPTKEGSLSFSIDRGDSGFYGDQSSYSTMGSNIDFYPVMENWDENQEYSFSSSSLLSSSVSLRRRTSQSLATRFDLSTSLRMPTISTISTDSQVYTNSSSGTNENLALCPPPKRRKLGLALLITVSQTADVDVIRRCVEHSNQLQSLVCRLRLATFRAGSGNKFVSTLYKATEDAARWLSDLMYGVRLQPLWSNQVTSDPRQSNKIAESIMSDLCSVIAFGDTKNTNFFISTLLTHVLTHHLGWVTTVSPYDAVDPTKLSKWDSKRPYNALWAQLGDLCGSIGFPPRTARTIVAGSTNTQFINRLLSVLTYFVRCGDVKRNDFLYQDCEQSCKVTLVDSRTFETEVSSKVRCVNDNDENLAVKTTSDSRLGVTDGLKKSTTLTNLSQKLSNPETSTKNEAGHMRRNPSIMIALGGSTDSSQKSSLTEESELEKKVVFVLGDDEKLVGLKNKSVDGKSVKRSSKVHNEPVNVDLPDKLNCDLSCEKKPQDGSSKCCSLTLEHSKPIKHSGFKFEFDKYPQIVTNYMKSKNLEILDRHYIGKPGNLKLDNFQFDPTIIPPIQEERCETCYKCQMMESVLQTPTNASEMEYMNDMPRQEPQYAKETVTQESQREMSPKTFVRKRKENTVIINVKQNEEAQKESRSQENASLTLPNTKESPQSKLQTRLISAKVPRAKKERVDVRQVIEFPLPVINLVNKLNTGFDVSLLGGVTDHYVPDLVLQGTLANPKVWEAELRRDLDLTLYLNKTLDSPMQAVAIVGDTNNWEVRILGRDCGCGGLSPLVGGMLDAIPAMRMARVPAHQCLLFLESKLREFCVLSKTLADMLMSTDFCDISTLTRSLNIDVNDVPLLLAVASTHTPQVATRYGITYR